MRSHGTVPFVNPPRLGAQRRGACRHISAADAECRRQARTEGVAVGERRSSARWAVKGAAAMAPSSPVPSVLVIVFVIFAELIVLA